MEKATAAGVPRPSIGTTQAIQPLEAGRGRLLVVPGQALEALGCGEPGSAGGLGLTSG